MSKRVTIQDIAKKLGVHFTTVGRGLRNDPRLADATVRKIQQMAAEMGYQPDPNARAMVAHRQAIRPATQRGNLVMLTPQLSSTAPNIYLGGARERAGKLGYQVEEIAWRDPELLTGPRLTQILRSRGAAGLLVFHGTSDVPLMRRLKLDWSLFPAVSLGTSLLWPPLHQVSPNHYRNTRQLVRKLMALGYRRIGFFVDAELNAIRTDRGWRAGYLVEMERHGPIPPPLYRKNDHYDESGLRDWIRQNQLDVILTDHSYAAERVISLCGQKVPEDMGVVTLHAVNSESPAISGIDQHLAGVGAMGVNFLVNLIHTHERGIPELPQRLLLEGTWSEGTTVRRIR